MIRLNRYIDHSLLQPDATPAAIEELCAGAIEHNFKAVCTNSSHTALVADLLKGHNTVCAATVGFPLGAMATRAKVAEAYLAMCQGADEIDMVMPIGLLKAGQYNKIVEEVRTVKDIIGISLLKVIIETAYLDRSGIEQACKLVEQGGADFVKTSTGFAPTGATTADIRLIRACVGDRLKIKASGGIRSGKQALQLIAAGADRIGTSDGPGLLATQK